MFLVLLLEGDGCRLEVSARVKVNTGWIYGIIMADLLMPVIC